MQDEDREPLATIALIAAFADGYRSPEETAQLQQIAADIGGSDYGTIARMVLSGQSGLHDVAARLTSDEARQKAYDLAVSVVHADGLANVKEKAFLKDLRGVLGLAEASTASIDQVAAELAASAAVGTGPDLVAVSSDSTPEALDAMVLKNAMLAGALELLPQNLAALAIVPLQLRMVYKIGQDHGQKLDMDQVKDLAGTMGIGAAGQVMEGVARRALGGLAKGIFGRTIGGVVGGAAGAASGVALTFATTYALGQTARKYYGQGRSLGTADLRQLFQQLREEAKTMFPKVENQIKEQARTLDFDRLLRQIRG